MRRLPILLALLSLFFLPASSAHAAASSGPMPRGDYPFHAAIQVIDPADNQTWDCGIAIDCATGEPFVHSLTSEELGRVTGWAVVSMSHHRALQFLTTSNVFAPGVNADGVPLNHAALQDETETMPTWQVAYPVALTLPALPADAQTLTFRIAPTKKYLGVLFVSVAWGPTAEVELLALYSTRYARQAQRLILAQLRDSITASPATEPAP